MPSFKESLLSSAKSIRGTANTFTLLIAFVLSIMVINNYRQCDGGKGYPDSSQSVKISYIVAIVILIACCLLFSVDLAVMTDII